MNKSRRFLPFHFNQGHLLFSLRLKFLTNNFNHISFKNFVGKREREGGEDRERKRMKERDRERKRMKEREIEREREWKRER